MFKPCLFALCFCLLCACGNEDKAEKAVAAQAPVSSAPASLPPAAPAEPAPDDAALARADDMLAYHNRILASLARGSQADALMTRTQVYLSTWRLPKAVHGGRHSGFRPPKGLFSPQEEADIAKALADMDKALAEMAANYANLEKYVRDPSIQDDGRQGKALAARIGLVHARYIKARESWLSIVENAAKKAEKILLYEHPLKRQILAANAIFAQFREVADLLGAGETPPDLLKACESNLRRLLADAGKPPFPAKPVLEMYYRDFLRQASVYVDILNRGREEGFHTLQKRELNAAAEACRLTYNRFAENVNKG